MEYDYIPQRITSLRIQKGVSEYQMSLDLGHSRSYMQNTSSGKSKPSIEEFLYICEYLNVTPQAFFDEAKQEPILIQRAAQGLNSLSARDLELVIHIIDKLNGKE